VKFWEQKKLSELSASEWEALCDGCGKCCLNKLEDEDTGKVHYTDVACKLLDKKTCQCMNYLNRHAFVPDCITLSVRNIKKMDYMPKSCAYRLRSEGKSLPWWHHLVCGDRQMVHKAGMSAKGKVVSELEVPNDDDWEGHIVDWPNRVKPKISKPGRVLKKG
jgi:uncharacterized cysteine cluster protein YcgN (CxxCxxCC family)